MTNGTETLIRLGVAAFIIVVAWVLVRLIRRSVDRFVARGEAADPSLRTRLSMIQRLAAAAIYFLALGLALWALDIGALRQLAVAMFASAGVVGIALGLAAQTTAGNLVAGIMLALVQPIRLGDRVRVAGHAGIVEDIGLFYSRIRTWDNRQILVPSQMMNTSVLENFTLCDQRMPAVVTFTLGAESDPVTARQLLERWTEEHVVQRAAGSDVERWPARVEVIGETDGKAKVRLIEWSEDYTTAWELSVRLARNGAERLRSAGLEVVGYELESSGPAGPP